MDLNNVLHSVLSNSHNGILILDTFLTDVERLLIYNIVIVVIVIVVGSYSYSYCCSLFIMYIIKYLYLIII